MLNNHQTDETIIIKENHYDVLVIGAGPGGLSAAAAAMARGTAQREKPFRVAVLERDEIPGGILNQCVHDGFGIVRYGAQLSGPEYGEIEAAKAGQAGAEILTGWMVTEIAQAAPTGAKSITGEASEDLILCSEARDPGKAGNTGSAAGEFLVTAISRQGREVLRARSIVIATGCRERTRGMLSIPGTRPAGIYTAGVAQNLINRRNLMVGRRVVILGSGDIGLIMARRLTLEGAKVLCVAEVMPEPSGLARNVRQCLFDFNIPLYLNTTVSNIIGKGRLQAVELSRVDEHFRPVAKPGHRVIEWPQEEARRTAGPASTVGTESACSIRELQPDEVLRIDCDTLILSVGLIPENEVAQTAGVALDKKTNGTITDEYLQTSVPGIFACGNARAVMDLADFVSEQGEAAGANAAAYALGQPLHQWKKNPHNVARKGLPEENSVTCTLCPKGCQVRVEADGSVTGNGCPRGEAFALQEMTDPHRILTTTILVHRRTEEIDGQSSEAAGSESGSPQPAGLLLPVRSDRPVPLREMQMLVRQLQKQHITMPAGGIRRGDALIHELGSAKVDIIAEAAMPGSWGSIPGNLGAATTNNRQILRHRNHGSIIT